MAGPLLWCHPVAKVPALDVAKPAETPCIRLSEEMLVLKRFLRFDVFTKSQNAAVWAWHPDAGVKFALRAHAGASTE